LKERQERNKKVQAAGAAFVFSEAILKKAITSDSE
jgi:hypothetical protein